jgi:dipeptidyl aminopeptidase/acylaminoacyl peptidase
MKHRFLPLLVATLLVLPALFAQERMTPELLWKLGRVSLSDVSPDGKTVLFSVRHYSVAENSGSSKSYSLDVKSGQISALDLPFSEAQYLGENRLGGIENGQFMVSTDGGKSASAVALLKGENYKAISMADGRILLLFTQPFKFKNTTADNYPNLPKANAQVFDDLMYRHWDSWNDEFVNHLCYTIYDPAKGASSTYTDIMGKEPFDVPNPPMGGAESFTASPDGKYIVYSCKKKVGKEFAVSTNTDLYLYNIETKTTTNLTEGMMGYDNHPQFSPDGTKLAWASMPTDGYESDVNRLWMYDFGTKAKSQPLNEEYVDDFQWVDNFRIAYNVPKQATQQIGIIDFRLKGASQERIITSGDYNYGAFMMRGKTLIASRTDMNHAAELFSVDMKTGKATQITHTNDEIYNNLSMGKIEKRWIKTTDGKDMLTWVIYPPNFDPAKKYPTLLYCQGGPQSAVSQFYSFRWNFQLMAANDYIIVAPNRRGLPGFGKAWNEEISQDWGGQAMKDYFSAIDELAKEPFVDKDKLGAVGASYGGYSVYMLAGIHENRFKAFVSHCGLFNLESWYGTTEELFFANYDVGGSYWQNPIPKSYFEFSPHRFVQNWNTPILVIHGGKDFRVPENQGMEAFQAAQLKGIPSKFLYFPEEGHWVLQPQNGVIWHTEYFKWLDQWLK